jgi:hypothetical protein
MLDMAFRIVETRYTPVGAHECANLHVTDILHLVPPFLYSYCTNTANIACKGRHEWWSMVEKDICVYLVPLCQTPSPTSVQPSHPDLYITQLTATHLASLNCHTVV